MNSVPELEVDYACSAQYPCGTATSSCIACRAMLCRTPFLLKRLACLHTHFISTLSDLDVHPILFHAHPSTVFQQLEVDYCLQRPRNDVWPSRAQQVPVVRLFGVNDAGVWMYGVMYRGVMCWCRECVGWGGWVGELLLAVCVMDDPLAH
jgi:hypothetical protein